MTDKERDLNQEVKQEVEQEKQIVYKVEEGMDVENILCTTYQMRNFYKQFHDGFFSSLDVMNYIQHFAAAKLARKDQIVLDACCGRSLMLPLLRYHARNIKKYIGVDISERNINEAKRGVNRDLRNTNLEEFYPFETEWILSNIAEMSDHIEKEIVDFIIYTSAIEHMHKDVGYQSLIECHKVLKNDGIMFLSSPNTPGYGYDTQYAAHVYEWGYDELKEAIDEIGFEIVDEIGLVMGAREMDQFYENHESEDIRELYKTIRNYLPTNFITSLMSIPYPEESKEVLFILKKKEPNRLF